MRSGKLPGEKLKVGLKLDQRLTCPRFSGDPFHRGGGPARPQAVHALLQQEVRAQPLNQNYGGCWLKEQAKTDGLP